MSRSTGKAKPALPRVPLPRQRGGAHGARNEKQEKTLEERIQERLNDPDNTDYEDVYGDIFEYSYEQEKMFR